MSLFRCPLCASPLERTAHTYRCPAGHSFDIAKEGYVHLLPPNQKHSAAPGDDQGHGRRPAGISLQRVLQSIAQYAL